MTGSSVPYQRIWVFSDLHLADTNSFLYRAFIDALSEPENDQDAVVFAGDIFEIFVGNSTYFHQKHQGFIAALKTLSRKKVALYYIEGNHDFHLKKAFGEIPVQIFDAEVVIGSIYIAHGDLVDQSDSGYLRMRKFFRSAGFKKFVELLPGKAVEWIGETIARTHEQKEGDLSFEPGSVPSVRKIFRAYAEEKKRQGFDFIILGHCHDLDDLQPFYFNMGYPPVHRQFLYYSSESNSFKRRNFSGN
jgi:UDP-2,3-diacylglucosamine hydrolase